jgi:hypothetical protein
MVINLANVEDIIFYDKNLQKHLPEMSSIFQQWVLGKQIPQLRSLCQKAILEFFEKITDRQISVLANYLNEEEVILEKFNSHIVRNCSTSFSDDVEKYLNLIDENFIDFAISRDKNSLYISLWK